MNLATAYRILKAEFPTRTVGVSIDSHSPAYVNDVDFSYTASVHGIPDTPNCCAIASSADLAVAVRDLLDHPAALPYRSHVTDKSMTVHTLQRDISELADKRVLEAVPF